MIETMNLGLHFISHLSELAFNIELHIKLLSWLTWPSASLDKNNEVKMVQRSHRPFGSLPPLQREQDSQLMKHLWQE